MKAGVSFAILVAAAQAGASIPPTSPTAPPTVSPDGLPIVMPVELRNCALEIHATGDATDTQPTRVKVFENGLVRIERPLPEAESQRKTADLLIQLDKGWYAQGRPSVYRVTAPDNDTAKLSAPVLGLVVEVDFADALAKANLMTFWDDRIKRETFELAKLDRALIQRWQECIKSQPTSLATQTQAFSGYRLQAPLQPVTPRNKAGWFTMNDYPTRALREELQGMVAFTLEVSVNGLVRDCSLTEHNTPTIVPSVNDVPELNAETCRILRRRARFVPSTDAEGRPLLSYFLGRVRWVIPNDEPSPPLRPD